MLYNPHAAVTVVVAGLQQPAPKRLLKLTGGYQAVRENNSLIKVTIEEKTSW